MPGMSGPGATSPGPTRVAPATARGSPAGAPRRGARLASRAAVVRTGVAPGIPAPQGRP